jgi:hypothetical protein
MGLLGKVRAYKSGWGEIIGPLPPWLKANGVIEFGSETILTARLAPGTHVDLIESHGQRNWQLTVESWAAGGTLRRGPAQVIGRSGTPPVLLRAIFVRACLSSLEDFEEHYSGPIEGLEVFERIHELRNSGLL